MGLREPRFLRARRPRTRAGVVLTVLVYFLVAIFLLGVSVGYTPHMVDGMAYVAGAGGTDTFIAKANGEDCSRKGGCRPFTTGVLERSGTAVTWPGKVAPGSRFPVRAPAWPLGLGRTIISGTGDAVGAIVETLVPYAMALFLWGIPVFVVISRLRERRRSREQAGRYRRA